MKKFYYIIIGILLLIGIPACQRHTDYPHAMQQAEKLMDARPDSALHLLQGMADTLTMLPDEAQMYYHLLTIQAKDKQYITHTNDSLINRIVAFYKDLDDKERLMMAYYYQGSVYRDMNDAPRALKAFQQAETTESTNIELLTKVYSQMGYLFTFQGLYDEAIRVNKASVKLYQSLGQENKAYFALRDIARGYESKEMNDSALFYYQECYHTAQANKDSVKIPNILGELGRLYHNIGQTTKAKELLLDLWHNSTLGDKSHIDLTLGYIYLELQQLDSAYFHFQKVLPIGNTYKQYYSHKGLFSIEYEKQNYWLASKHANEALSIKEEIEQTIQTEAIAKINSLYNYKHIEEENLKLKLTEEHSNNIILVLLIVVLIFVVLSLLLFVRHQSMKGQYQINKLKLERFQEKGQDQTPVAISENQKKIEELETSLKNDAEKDSVSEKQLVYMQLQHLRLRNQEIQLSIEQEKLAIQTLKHTDIYKLFKRASLGEDIKIGKKQWKKLQIEAQKVYPNFLLHLKELYPKATDVEVRICLLTKLGMPQAHIAKVLGYTRGGISLSCERLHEKIFGTKCNAKEFALFIEKF